MHGTLGPFFFIVLTPAVTRGFGFISFKLKVPALHKATAIDKRLAGRALTQSNPNRAFFYRKILVNRGIFDSTFKPKEFFKPLMAPAKMRGSIDKSIDVLALARLYNLVRYRRTCFHRRTGFPLTPTYFSELGIGICFCL